MRKIFSNAILSFLLVMFSTMFAGAQQVTALPPNVWHYSATSVVQGSSGPTFTGWPSITVPAEAGLQHVLNCIDFSIGTTSSGGGTYAVLQVEDGVAGSTVLKAWNFVPLIGTQHVDVCGLNTVGTTGNAMTIEIVPGGNGTGFLSNEFATINVEGKDYN